MSQSLFTASIKCPYCHKQAVFQPAREPMECAGCKNVGEAPAIWRHPQGPIWWIGVCPGCQRPVLIRGRGEEVHPPPRPQPAPEEVPEPIRRDFEEARLCFAAGAYRACAVMARRVVEAMAEDKLGKPHKRVSLSQRIDALCKKGVIRGRLKDSADVLRTVGNDAAHADAERAVTKEDAQDVLELLSALLEQVYRHPTIAERQRRKRQRTRPRK